MFVHGAGRSRRLHSGGSGWDVLVAPYVMGAAMKGTTAFGGVETNAEPSASDIFSNLQFGAMGLLVARKGDWCFGADAVWMALGTTVRETNNDFNQGAFAFHGLSELGPAADVRFGRVNTLQGELTLNRRDHEVDPIGLTSGTAGSTSTTNRVRATRSSPTTC